MPYGACSMIASMPLSLSIFLCECYVALKTRSTIYFHEIIDIVFVDSIDGTKMDDMIEVIWGAKGIKAHYLSVGIRNERMTI